MKESDQPVIYIARDILRFLHLDVVLLLLLVMLIGSGLVIIYSAGGESQSLLISQLVRLGVALVVMLMLAQISPSVLRRWSPWIYAV
ncbi:MAG: hypothetical protein R3312_09765, partial [Gammaproteobacteria bacterium]|nr:hypothetical protein [Gammaproteobacteria bacterium]